MSELPLEIFTTAAARVPAYRAFLEERLGGIPRVDGMEEFARLPFTDKKSYILAHPLKDLCLDGTLEGKHFIYRSSGTTRSPLFWPKLPEEERELPRWLEAGLERAHGIRATPTLVIVGLGLGSWVSGEQTSWAMRTLAVESGRLTVITPGLNVDEIVEIIETFCPQFPQTLLICYPPFAKTIVERAAAQGIPLKDFNMKLGFVGEGYSERFRRSMGALLGHRREDVMAIWSGYGSADFGAVGQETPLSITIRRLLHERCLAREVLGADAIPSLCQYNPASLHLESVEGELVISRLQAVPLVRYRTADKGEILPWDELMGRMRRAGCDPIDALKELGHTEEAPRLPFVLVYGRADGTITFYGANISAEQVREALEAPGLREHLTGTFRIAASVDETLDPVFEVFAEVKEGAVPPDAASAGRILAEELSAINSEYASSLARQGASALPRVTWAGSEAFHTGLKNRYT